MTGVTAHFIDDDCDSGDIIEQQRIDISDIDTGQDILEKFKVIYPNIIHNVLKEFDSGKINRHPQDHNNSSFFGKRTPDDGLINWNSMSKNIYNWVRAQSSPYPGAFTYYHSQKVIIDWVEIIKYIGAEPPGTIININPLMVKRQDGAVIIKRIRNNRVIKFYINSVFQNE
jgi:methionyl-tRNA formyltransferase